MYDPSAHLKANLRTLCALTDLNLGLEAVGHLTRLKTHNEDSRAKTSLAATLCRTSDKMLTNQTIGSENGRSVETKDKLKCFWPKCQFKTSDPKHLKDHYSVHQKTRNQFKCDAINCQKTFKYKQNLIQHKLSHKFSANSFVNRKSLFVCDFNDCRKSFQQKYQLIRHKAGHQKTIGHNNNNQKNNHNNHNQNLIFAHKSNVLGNSQKMSNENNNKTQVVVSTKTQVMTPKKQKEKRFVCDFNGCDKCFDSKSNLERHKRIHSGEKPFGCDIPGCGQRFTQKTHLVQHKKRKHRIILPKNAIKLIKPLEDYEKPTEERLDLQFTPSVISTPKISAPVVKPQPAVNNSLTITPIKTACDKSLSLNSSLKTSSVQRQYKCYIDKCHYSYDSLYELKTHVNSVHPNDSLTKCNHSNCNQVFKSFYNLYYHKKTFHHNL